MARSINLPLTDELLAFLDENSGDGTLFSTPSEFVRALIRDVADENIYILAIKHSIVDLPRRLEELEPQLVHEAELLHDRIAADDRDVST